jgi:Beta-lactamase enzyme family
MNRIHVRPVTASLALVAIAGTAAAAAVTTAAGPAIAAPGRAASAPGPAALPVAMPASVHVLCTAAKGHRRFAAWLGRGLQRAIDGRDSTVGLAVFDPRLGLSCALNPGYHFDAASAIKVTIISALLLEEGGTSHLTSAQRNLAWLMITQSDNNAASDLWNEVGISGMQRFLDRARMRHTDLNDAWGLTQLTAHDELTLLKLLASPGKVLSTSSRHYVLWLMAHVIASQRWGVTAGAPASVRVSVKNGWLPYPTDGDWHVNSLGVFSGPDVSYQIAILTSDDPSKSYGIAIIEAAARVINRDVARG